MSATMPTTQSKDKKPHKPQHRYPAMTPVDNDSIKSQYTPDTFFDDFTPCITVAWDKASRGGTSAPQLAKAWEHLNSSTQPYYIFEIPERAIHGFLYLDKGEAYFRDYHKGRLSHLRLRYQPTATGTAILSAFWVPHQQRLIIHDAFMFRGKSLTEQVFTTRWKSIQAILAAIEEDRAFQGFRLEVLYPVNEAPAIDSENHVPGPAGEATTSENMSSGPAGEAVANKNMRRGPAGEVAAVAFGLIFQPNTGIATVIHSIPIELLSLTENKQPTTILKRPVPKSIDNDRVMVDNTVALNEKNHKTGIFILRKHTKFTGPESFQLFQGEEDVGMPSIQSLSMVKAIREKLAKSTEISVKAQWNKHINNYSIIEVL